MVLWVDWGRCVSRASVDRDVDTPIGISLHLARVFFIFFYFPCFSPAFESIDSVSFFYYQQSQQDPMNRPQIQLTPCAAPANAYFLMNVNIYLREPHRASGAPKPITSSRAVAVSLAADQKVRAMHRPDPRRKGGLKFSAANAPFIGSGEGKSFLANSDLLASPFFFLKKLSFIISRHAQHTHTYTAIRCRPRGTMRTL
jgi:hypothetical protein